VGSDQRRGDHDDPYAAYDDEAADEADEYADEDDDEDEDEDEEDWSSRR
jgi:hypothetical protein